MRILRIRRHLAIGVGVALVAGLAVTAIVLAARSGKGGRRASGQQVEEDGEGNGAHILARAVHPRKDASLRVTVQQLLSVKPFIQVDLRPQVAGVVVKVPKSLGAEVKDGSLLAEIAVPDLDQSVIEKAAVIRQRQKEVELARAQVANAEAQVEVARELVEQRRAEAKQAVETREYRKSRWERYKQALAGRAVQDVLEEESRRDYLSAVFAVDGADSAVRKAAADVKEKESILLAARADVELKEALVDVARGDHAHAEALAGYARITAPFDGVLVGRNVDEGTFVQNATSGQTQPMLTIARMDIVTVVMNVPDNYAPFVTRATEAVLHFDELPGVEIRGLVTRFSRSINNRDRTMRVEVDLWNDTPADYRKFAGKCLSSLMAPLAAANPFGVAFLTAAGNRVWRKNSKDRADPFPVLPVKIGGKAAPVKLLPGMSGYMRLNLSQFDGAYLLPSSAIFNRGGKPYILEVVDGKSHLVPVHVQVDDGRWAKLDLIQQEEDPAHGKSEKLADLTGAETIIINRQIEIGDGQPVEVAIEDK